MIINSVITGGGSPAPAHYIEKSVDANGKLVRGSTIINMSGVTDVGNYALYNAYYNNTAISGVVDMSDLITISGVEACACMFLNCTGITNVNLSSLTTISGDSACSSMFQGCTGLISADLSALTAINDYACSGMFKDCTSLTTVYIGGTSAITFGVSPLAYIFEMCEQNMDVYAPATNQAEIEAMEGYPDFGSMGTVTWHWRS